MGTLCHLNVADETIHSVSSCDREVHADTGCFGRLPFIDYLVVFLARMVYPNRTKIE